MFKKKNDNLSEHIWQNFDALLFCKDTGIIIANVDKGRKYF